MMGVSEGKGRESKSERLRQARREGATEGCREGEKQDRKGQTERRWTEEGWQAGIVRDGGRQADIV